MSAAWIVAAGLATLLLGSIAFAGWVWLARSWEVLDDDELHRRLFARGTPRSSTLWARMRFWARPRHRQLTYRRDERGRFRRHRR